MIEKFFLFKTRSAELSKTLGKNQKMWRQNSWKQVLRILKDDSFWKKESIFASDPLEEMVISHYNTDPPMKLTIQMVAYVRCKGSSQLCIEKIS